MTARRRTSLHALLRRAHLGFALGVVALVGIVLAGPGLVTLHVYAEHDLRLLARATAYTLEAAVVFEDKDATAAGLRIIANPEDILSALVTNEHGVVLAQWTATTSGWHPALVRVVSGLLFDGPVRVPVLHDGEVVGHVEVEGGAGTLLWFLVYGALGILLCQAAAAAGALYLSSRIQRRIIRPIRRLAEITGTVQRDRAFTRRVPHTDIKELDELGATFNLLLTELGTWQAGITDENERLSHEASHDKLTGLRNRAHFEAQLNRAVTEIANAPRKASQDGRPHSSLAVMLLDCNGFKQVNDTHGHAAGDMVLVVIAARLRAHMRKGDLVARIGGDEFAVLFIPSPPPAVLDTLARSLDDVMRADIPVMDGQTVIVGLSIGLARYPDDAANMESLLHHADLAMYRNKQAGRHQPKER